MQDIHSIGGRFFPTGDRRLRPQSQFHHGQAPPSPAAVAPPPPPALKCPRCDSGNTKFCYYNNYNLSQPRHFCKSCRRYWTKGGVLRNVPVGGGCRKTKRSSKSKPTSTTAATTTAAIQPERKSPTSNSSSESSSLTATTEAVSAPTPAPAPLPPTTQIVKPTAPPISASDCGIFSEIGAMTSLIGISAVSAATSAPAATASSFGFGSIGDVTIGQFRLSQSKGVDHEAKVGLMMEEDEDRTAEVELERSNGGGGFGDWQQCGSDQGLFDLTNTVDQAYWSQTQWNDPSLYLP